MSRSDSVHAGKRQLATRNAFSTLPEVDTRKDHELQGKELRPTEGKEAVPRDVGGLEVLPGVYGKLPHTTGIEVAGANEKESLQALACYGDAAGAPNAENDREHINRYRRRRMRRNWLIGGIVLLAILAIALGAGLGVSLRLDDNKTESPTPTSSSNSTDTSDARSTLSTRGAFNGSGISIRRQGNLLNLTSGQMGTSNNDDRNLLLAFQHHTGDLRWMQRVWPNTWQGGSEGESITTAAKNATPLSIMGSASTEEGVFEWHVFYVSKHNKLQQQTIDNKTFTWHSGLLDELQIDVLDADKTGLVSCYYNGPIDDASYNSTSSDSGIRLFVAASETTFKQISWQPGMPSWVVEQQWNGFNGRAQPACNGWSAGTVTYTMFVDQDDQVAFYWRDHGESGRDDDPNHPMNTWVKASLNIPAVDPSSGLSYGFGGNLFARTGNNGPVLGWNITFDAENTSISGSSLSQVSGHAGAPDSSLASWSISPEISVDGEYEVLVFYQTEGDDITVFSGDVDSGDWTAESLPIPYD